MNSVRFGIARIRQVICCCAAHDACAYDDSALHLDRIGVD